MRPCLRRLLVRLRSHRAAPGLLAREAVSTIDGRASTRAARVALLIDGAVDGDELDAAIAAASVDERADARALLDLAVELALDELQMIALRCAFLVAGEDSER